MIIHRQITENVKNSLFKGKAIIIYGPRQAGKTTLVKQIIETCKKKTQYYNCDFLDIQEIFAYKNAGKLTDFLKDIDLLVLDEAQRIKNIGMTLKIIVENYPKLQVIATGSSSFDLSNEVNEPLTGRKIEFTLFPFSINEVSENKIDYSKNIEKFLRFGGYPEPFHKSENEKILYLKGLTNEYLFKDVFTFQDIRKPELLTNLLKLLAFQIGQEVSFTELSQKLGTDQAIVQKYVKILEDSFVIFRLSALSRNMRNEVSKTRKIYFYDLGVRNTLIQNYNDLETRNDVGFLWENFCVLERMKQLSYKQDFRNVYFWRNYKQKEIDYIEEQGGEFTPFEFKWSESKKALLPKDFSQNYTSTDLKIIHKNNLAEFIDI
jgi:predicted AAA+ superfamily ATPase